VALKIVDKGTLSKARAKQKLQSEISIHRKLQHKHIVKFERFFEDSTHVYITMELCNNNSMTELMKRRKTLVEPEVRYYINQIVEGLRYLHDNLVIHRDLKLGNLFIDHDMRIKIGDFGLATKLTHPNERKRTVCGTPNYIAPEILEGKEGHSFEVDIWSTGVLIFTLLFGKPPFESKDVKSTYKQILANNYAFPAHSEVAESARVLIRQMLQHVPENRPGLDGVMGSEFFAQPAYTPTFLPSSALKTTPAMPSTMKHGAQPAMKQFGGRPVNDENDPNNANQMFKPVALVTKPSAGSAPATSAVVPTAAEFARKPLARLEEMMSLPGSGSSAPPQRVTRSQQGAQQQTQNFAIYSDAKVTGKRHSAAVPVAQEQLMKGQRPSSSSSSRGASGVDQGMGMTVDDNSASLSTKRRLSGSSVAAATVPPFFASGNSASGAAQSLMEVSEGHTESQAAQMQQQTNSTAANGVVQFDEGESNMQRSGRLSGSGMEVSGHGQPRQAWGGSSDLPQEFVASSSRSSSSRAVGPAGQPQTQPLFVSPPKETHRPLKVPNTLEVMHDTLISKFSLTGSQETREGDDFGSATGGRGATNLWGQTDGDLQPYSMQAAMAGQAEITSAQAHQFAADVWVVRYVDYTSKYGLGFLLNNGVAGVYFNDNTKIVLSTEGSVFQYIERKRRSGSSSSAGVGEHVFSTYPINAYPTEMQKKVTLLKHFRNYLVDQQRIFSEGGNTETGENGGFPASVSTGSSSSLTTLPAPAKVGDRVLLDTMGGGSTPNIPFLKKWVKTRHAILFRLSNKTVQVVFFDRSEILLTAEAHVITYVNKEGMRSEHSLQEALQSGRVDVIKRLKYAKDIMYKLINIQAAPNQAAGQKA
jgi:serine/threonine protein kinase